MKIPYVVTYLSEGIRQSRIGHLCIFRIYFLPHLSTYVVSDARRRCSERDDGYDNGSEGMYTTVWCYIRLPSYPTQTHTPAFSTGYLKVGGRVFRKIVPSHRGDTWGDRILGGTQGGNSIYRGDTVLCRLTLLMHSYALSTCFLTAFYAILKRWPT